LSRDGKTIQGGLETGNKLKVVWRYKINEGGLENEHTVQGGLKTKTQFKFSGNKFDSGLETKKQLNTVWRWPVYGIKLVVCLERLTQFKLLSRQQLTVNTIEGCVETETHVKVFRR
jgi:hypothetical protein